MSLYVIGDLHLSVGVEKPMDVFGGWENYTEKLIVNWKQSVSVDDTVVIPGDVSWGMTLPEALPDFQLLESLPGVKILLKGNHDYWWETASKMTRFFVDHGLTTIKILHNNTFSADGALLCGTRGWLNDAQDPHNRKILFREAERLRMSLRAANGLQGERLAFLHYPPMFRNSESEEITEVLREFGIRRCFFGHIHGENIRYAFEGVRDGVEYRLVSADALGFQPLRIEL